MSERSAGLLIGDIWDAILKIERYTVDMDHDAFLNDERTVDAVVRNLEIIGEAAKRLPTEFRARYSNVEWPKIIGLRHRIVHDYFGIDMEIIWRILRNDLALLRSALIPILSDLGLPQD